MNVEIGNPTYKMYEGGEPDDVGGLLDADFALDPDKVDWRPSKGLPGSKDGGGWGWRWGEGRTTKGVVLSDGSEVGARIF